ncbi:MAG: hypothetical protein KF823_09155 [Xanthomonadales bacterium]|nr:hypothetical protein [Xanthomonadales bacterium]
MKKTAAPLLVALTGCLALSACSGREVRTTPLTYVPHDSPYVFANLEPVPDQVTEAWWALFEPVRAAFSETLAKVRKQAAAADDEAARRTLAVMDLFEDKFTLEGWERIGFSRRGLLAFYGVGAIPVLRIELADPDALRGFIGEIESRVGETLPVARLGDLDYWRMQPDEDKPFAVAMAIIDRQLVLTFDPGAEIAPLEELLGVRQPSRSMADSGELAQLNRNNGYGPHGTFLFDSVRLVHALVGREGAETWLTRKAAADGDPVSATCQREFAQLAGLMPRLVAGYGRMDARHMESRMTLELRPDIAEGLLPVAAPVPGLGDLEDGVQAEFGYGLRLDKLGEFLQKQSAAVSSAPWACDKLASLNDSAGQIGGQVAGLYMAGGLMTGLRAVVTRLDWEGLAMPTRVEGALIVASPNPASLVGMAGGFLPAVAGLQLSPGAPPQRLDLASLGEAAALAPPTWVALSDSALGLGFGDDGGALLPRFLGAPSRDPAPVLSFGYRGPFYAELMKQVRLLQGASALLSGQDDGADDEPGQRFQREMQRVMESFVEAMDQVTAGMAYTRARFMFTGRGLEVVQDVELAR